MFRFENILFPVEFSQRDEAAAPFVLSMAQRYHARVILLHVVQPPPPIYTGMNAAYLEVFERDAFDSGSLQEELLVDLRKFATAQLPKVPVDCVVEAGDPATVIAKFGSDRGLQLIAMPTHGYGVFRRALLGSVTAKVLHDSTLPLWTSAHSPEPSHRAHPQPRRILCALDMKPESQKTLDAAIALADDTGASLELVYVPVEPVSLHGGERHVQHLFVGADSASVEELGQVDNGTEIETGSVAEVIRTLALRKRADLVVIGRGAIQGGLAQLHAHCYDIIRESPCPVLSV